MLYYFMLYLTINIQMLLVYATDNCHDGFPIRTTNNGKVRGVISLSRNETAYASFRGIPYAEPPIDSLRFAPPRNVSNWGGIRNATRDAPICIQQDFLLEEYPDVEGEEDCLYLNVYSPKTSCYKENQSELLPVIFFIHNGAFMSGSSRSDIVGPEYFMDYEVVLVTFNYRLGVLGFLSTYDDEAPGNWAFKDQLAALRWVHNNIKYFGGNKSKVTIMGHDAGAASVHHFILNPSAKGLFQKAISMSGTALALWSTPMRRTYFNITAKTASIVSCYQVDPRELVQCLRRVPAYDLVNAANVFRTMIHSEPIMPYFPAIERRTTRNPEPFITEDPGATILNGNIHNVPWIIGVVPGDGIFRAAPFVRQDDIRTRINNYFDILLKEFIGVRLSVEPKKIDLLWSQIKNNYFGTENQLNSTDSITGLINLYSDRAFIYPTYQTIHMHNYKKHKNMFLYNFDYRGKYSHVDLFAGTTNNTLNYKWGTSHYDDLLYLFHSPARFPNYKLPDVDMKVSKKMLDFVINFVKYGDPTPQHLFRNNQRWEPLPDTLDPDPLEKSVKFLDLSGSFEDNLHVSRMKNIFYVPSMHFWRSKLINENKYFANATSKPIVS